GRSWRGTPQCHQPQRSDEDQDDGEHEAEPGAVAEDGEALRYGTCPPAQVDEHGEADDAGCGTETEGQDPGSRGRPGASEKEHLGEHEGECEQPVPGSHRKKPARLVVAAVLDPRHEEADECACSSAEPEDREPLRLVTAAHPARTPETVLLDSVSQ